MDGFNFALDGMAGWCNFFKTNRGREQIKTKTKLANFRGLLKISHQESIKCYLQKTFNYFPPEALPLFPAGN